MKEIPLTQGYVATVDDADYEAVSAHKWHIKKARQCIYAVRKIRLPDGRLVPQYLHRFLMPGIKSIDHKDGNALNNSRESNLRAATPLQNKRGFQHKRVGASSKYRGVTWHARIAKWQCRIRVLGKLLHLGYFPVEKSAARAYDKAARQYFGDFAAPNF